MLRKNYEGCELDRLYLQNKIPKVGADTVQMNAFVRRVTQDIAESISWMPNGRGGRYEASIWSFYGYEWMKAHCGALPDGRLRGQSLSRGLNPSERTPAELSAILHTILTCWTAPQLPTRWSIRSAISSLSSASAATVRVLSI